MFNFLIQRKKEKVDFKSANPIMRLRDGTAVRTWKNLAGVDHVFLADANDQMIYAGYVGWIHSQGLNEAITRIRRDFTWDKTRDRYCDTFLLALGHPYRGEFPHSNQSPKNIDYETYTDCWIATDC